MQKKNKFEFSISKFIQQKGKNEKKKAHFFGFFSFIPPVAQKILFIRSEVNLKLCEKSIEF